MVAIIILEYVFIKQARFIDMRQFSPTAAPAPYIIALSSITTTQSLR